MDCPIQKKKKTFEPVVPESSAFKQETNFIDIRLIEKVGTGRGALHKQRDAYMPSSGSSQAVDDVTLKSDNSD